MKPLEKNTQQSIPSTKVQRASKFVRTGVKIGRNYIKHYAKKAVNPQLDKEALHRDNAEDVYETLSELKGSALKVAQMMSMDRNLLPDAYADKFQMAQYAAPPLSYPLVAKTFRRDFGKSPSQIFDTFGKQAVNAASIGQVHQAELGEKKFAVKVQYPGVAESVSSDLKLVKPFAINILRLNEQDVKHYMNEVETMLLSETDYELELKRSVEISAACVHLENLRFPHYYPEYSSRKILTMQWMEGKHLDQFLATNPSQEVRNKIGQAMWNFYHFQMHMLKAVHADPHPGNFVIHPDNTLGVIDFGCVKEIPEDFYQLYFQMLDKSILKEEKKLMKLLYQLGFLYPDDKSAEKELFFTVFKEMTSLLVRPFYTDTFDFGNDSYFNEIYAFSEKTSKMKELKNNKRPRGAKDSLYLNRTYFGLYSILNRLRANITTHCAF